jgi:hypothetical protein
MFPSNDTKSVSSTESNDQIMINNLQTANPKLRHGFWAPPSTANVVEAASLFDAQGAAAAKAALDQDGMSCCAYIYFFKCNFFSYLWLLLLLDDQINWCLSLSRARRIEHLRC